MPKDTASATSSDATSKANLSLELSKLLKERSGHKTYSTKRLEQTRTLFGAPQSSDSLKLKQNKKVLKEHLEKIRNLVDQILGMLDEILSLQR